MDIAKGAGVERIGIISEKMIEEAGGRGSRRALATPSGPSSPDSTSLRRDAVRTASLRPVVAFAPVRADPMRS